MKRAQVALEFVLLFSVLFVLLVIFMGVVLVRTQSLGTENERLHLEDVARSVQTELYVAASVGDGYNRTIDLPQLLENQYNYTVRVSNNTFIAESENHEFVLTIPSIHGNITKGANTITTAGSHVYVTQ